MIFRDKYDDAFDLETIRKEPLSKEELISSGLTEQDVQEYFRLVENFYEECRTFSPYNCLKNPPKGRENKKLIKFQELLDFCFGKELISKAVYDYQKREFEVWGIAAVQKSMFDVDYWQFPEIPNVGRLESLDEFRLKMEEYLSERYPDWYLFLRYDVQEIYGKYQDEIVGEIQSDFYLAEYNIHLKRLMRLTNTKLRNLLSKIQADIREIDQKIAGIYIQSKSTTGMFAERQAIRQSMLEEVIALYKERVLLEECEGIVEERRGDYVVTVERKQAEEPEEFCCSNEILWIYGKSIRCHRNKHNIIPATAIIYNRRDKEIKINVEYCKDCDKYLLEYSLFENYKKKYGVLIANLRWVKNDEFNGDIDLANESPLKLAGYTVGQNEAFSAEERRVILARILSRGIMQKQDIIRYLTYFINMNGAKVGNENALAKWKADRDFVQNYNINNQHHQIIKEIRPYKK